MTKTQTTSTAAEQVAALERLKPGEPYAALAASSEQAITAERMAALSEIFGRAISTDACAWQAIAFHLEHGGPDLGAHLADLHRAALELHPALADLIRSTTSRAAVARASMATSGRLALGGREAAQAAAEAQHSFDVAIARALVDAGHQLAQSAAQLLASDALSTRLAAARAAHAAAARLEADRREAEQAAAEAESEAARQREAQEAVARLAQLEADRVGAVRAALLARGRALAGRIRASKQPVWRLPSGSAHSPRELADAALRGELSEAQLNMFEAGQPDDERRERRW